MHKLIITFTVLVLLFSCGTSKQTASQQLPQDMIRTDFTNYLDALTSKDFETSLEYMAPEIFTLLSKEQLLGVMEQTFNSPDLAFEFKESEILKIGKVVELENKYYAKLRYASLMNMKVLENEAEASSSLENKEMVNSLMKTSFEQTFGPENVEYDAESESYEIYAEKEVVCISEKKQLDWKFLVIEEEQLALLSTLLPSGVIEMGFE